MAVSHGMDVGDVRRLGGSLQTSAGLIDDLIGRIESAVSSSTWVGPDAALFKEQWWPERRGYLIRMRDDLHGLGQSAINNAADQERASDATGGGAISSAAVAISSERLTELRVEIAALEDPQAVSSWWSGLTEEERSAFQESDPGLIGNLDGIPPEVRYRANRINIERYVEDLRAELKAKTDSPLDIAVHLTPAGISEIAALNAKISKFEDLSAVGNQILLFDSTGVGRVAQVFGNLSNASRISVVIPGVGNNLDNFSSENAENLYQAMGGDDGNTATIQWLGYDTPDSATDASAKTPDVAADQANNLVSFVDGLKANSGAELSVVAHSYGTVYAAEAAKLDMKVDKVVLAGSPGIAAPDVTVFNGADVYAIGNEGDPVLAENPLVVGTELGTDPLTPEFGATVLEGNRSTMGSFGPVKINLGSLAPIDGANHSTYFDSGSVSLQNISEVIAPPDLGTPSSIPDDGFSQYA